MRKCTLVEWCGVVGVRLVIKQLKFNIKHLFCHLMPINVQVGNDWILDKQGFQYQLWFSNIRCYVNPLHICTPLHIPFSAEYKTLL